MRLRAAACVLLLAAAPAPAQVAPEGVERPPTAADLPEGYPPSMGHVTGTLDGRPVAWETFDFSIGAFDASAWAESDRQSGQVTLTIIGHAPGDPGSNRMRLQITGGFGPILRLGPAGANAGIAIFRGKDRDGARLTSEGRTAAVVIDSIGPKIPGSYSRQVTGHASAQLCPRKWPFKSCKDIALRFDTQVQFGSEMAIREN